MDWLDLLEAQETFKSLLQHHSSKASILQCSAFFITQLSHQYMTFRKTIALTRQTLVSKVMPLLFNMLPRLVMAFLPRSKRLLISWLQSPSAVILEPPPKSLPLFPLIPYLFAMKWWDWISIFLQMNKSVLRGWVQASYHRTRNWFQGLWVKFWALSDSITTFPSFKTLHTSLSIMSHILFFVREDFFYATTSQGY